MDPGLVGVLAIAAVLLSIGSLAVCAVLFLRLRALQRTYAVAVGGEPGHDLIAALAAQARGLEKVAVDVRTIHRNTEQLREAQRGAVSRLGLVRYDAFPDMGGMLSFSAAMLDEHGDGIVISAINGRQETRAYGKPVSQGTSEHSLSDEERAAVTAAMEHGRGVTLSTGVPRRRSRSS